MVSPVSGRSGVDGWLTGSDRPVLEGTVPERPGAGGRSVLAAVGGTGPLVLVAELAVAPVIDATVLTGAGLDAGRAVQPAPSSRVSTEPTPISSRMRPSLPDFAVTLADAQSGASRPANRALRQWEFQCDQAASPTCSSSCSRRRRCNSN